MKICIKAKRWSEMGDFSQIKDPFTKNKGGPEKQWDVLRGWNKSKQRQEFGLARGEKLWNKPISFLSFDFLNPVNKLNTTRISLNQYELSPIGRKYFYIYTIELHLNPARAAPRKKETFLKFFFFFGAQPSLQKTPFLTFKWHCVGVNRLWWKTCYSLP